MTVTDVYVCGMFLLTSVWMTVQMLVNADLNLRVKLLEARARKAEQEGDS